MEFTKREVSIQELLLSTLYTRANYAQTISLTQLTKFLADAQTANTMARFALESRYLAGYLDAFDALIDARADFVSIHQLSSYVKKLRATQQKTVLPATRPEEWLACREKIARYARGDALVYAAQSKTLDVHLRVLSYNVDTVTYNVSTKAVGLMREKMNVDQRRALAPNDSFLKSLTVVVAVPPAIPTAD